jgi:RNA polymerase sigma-B factor
VIEGRATAGSTTGRSATLPDLDDFRAYRSSGDRKLRNRIVEQHRGLAVALARRFQNRGEPLDDLVQVALLGVLKAVERFDPDRGVSFSSFATPTVLGELKRHFRDTTWAVKVPRGAKELHLKVGPTVNDLHQRLGRAPSVPEIALELEVSEELLLEAMEAGAAYQPMSISSGAATASDDAGPTLADRLGGLDEEHGRAEARVTVRRLMATLPDRERTILYLRYFEDLTQSEIAERVGISQMHVSRLLRQALEKLGQQA